MIVHILTSMTVCSDFLYRMFLIDTLYLEDMISIKLILMFFTSVENAKNNLFPFSDNLIYTVVKHF